MLYKGYCIEIWQSAWVNRRIGGEWYSLASHAWNADELAKTHKYIALFRLINWGNSGCVGGSTPLITFDLAKLEIDLRNKRSNRVLGIRTPSRTSWK